MKKVLVTGTFDLIHPGHLNFFSQAKEHGDELVILVARDETVKSVKGKMPAHTALQRKNLLEEIGVAKRVIIGNDSIYQVLDDEKPDVVCLGYDQAAFTEKLEEEIKKRGLPAKIVRLNPYKEHIYKTSILRQALLSKGNDLNKDKNTAS